MDINKIKELTHKWYLAKDPVFKFENGDLSELRALYRETIDILEEYREEELIPKQICALLLEMQDFGWWASSVEETPLGKYYEEIITLTYELGAYLQNRNYDINKIETAIENIK